MSLVIFNKRSSSKHRNKGYNNNLILLVKNKTLIQVYRVLWTSSTTAVRYRYRDQPVRKQEAFYMQKQQYSYSYFGAEMCWVLPSHFTPKRIRESVGRSCVSCSLPQVFLLVGFTSGRVQYSESEFWPEREILKFTRTESILSLHLYSLPYFPMGVSHINYSFSYN